MKKALPVALALALLLTGILFVPFYASPPDSGVDKALSDLGYTTIRLRKNVSNEYEVEAKLNGSKPVTMMISFQATNTIFDVEHLEEVGMKVEKTGQEYQINGDEGDIYVVRTDSINIGSGTIGPEELMAIKFDDFDVFEDYRVAGILGRDFLIKHHALIDFADQILYLNVE